MYQGCNKTAICSQTNIAASFVKLLKEKEYAKISISEICDGASVSRQTFYSLFKSKENIVSFELLRNYYFDPEKECKCCGKPSAKKLSEAFTEYIIEKEEFIGLLVKNNLMYLMQDCLCESFICCEKEDGAHEEIHCLEADLTAACLTTIAKHYVVCQDLVSKAELQIAIEKVLLK